MSRAKGTVNKLKPSESSLLGEDEKLSLLADLLLDLVMDELVKPKEEPCVTT